MKQIKELRSTMMSTLSEITANVAALEKRIIEMTSNNMDEKHKWPLYPLQDAAGTDINFIVVFSSCTQWKRFSLRENYCKSLLHVVSVLSGSFLPVFLLQ